MRSSDPQRPAVIVDPYSSGALFAPAFVAAGVPVVAVLSSTQPPEVYARSYRSEDYPEIITFEGDFRSIVRRIQETRPRCVIAGCESGVELADALAARIVPDVANVPELAAARRHKGAMAEAVCAAGLPVIRQICTADPAEVAAWIAREGLSGHDLVIKPPKSASTDGVTKVAGGWSWRAAFDAQLGRPNRLGLINDRLLVQEYATGTEYVVDTFSHGGRHTVTDVCRYHKVDNGSYMAVYESMEWVPPGDPPTDEVVDYAMGVLDAVGMRFGAAHTEVMLTAAGPRLIEIGARPHGGGHPRFCRVATGDSQVDRTVRYFGQLGPIPPTYQLRNHMRVVFLMSRAEGVVRNVGSLARVRDLASHHFSVVNMRDGDHLTMTRDLFGSLDLGFAVLCHPSREQVDADYHAMRRLEENLVIEPAIPGTAGR